MISLRLKTNKIVVKPKNWPGPARARKSALDITTVDINLFFSLQYRYNDHIWQTQSAGTLLRAL